MSTAFIAWCDLCEETGPTLKRKAGGAVLEDQDEWTRWLIDHEYHGLELRHE
jgi:hypothetical protein